MTSKSSILIVDDTPDSLMLLRDLLSSQGHEIHVASDGTSALLSARTAPPDLILLDVMMPGLSGYDVCERLKADPRTASIPIIFISALDGTLDKIRAFSLGGLDYISKPFQIDVVLARIRTHLALSSLQKRLQSQNQHLRLEIAERQRVEQELELRMQELEERNQELDAFSRTVAHDLKGPVAAMVNFAELYKQALSPSQDPELAKIHELMMRSGRRAIRIVDSLLLLAQVRRTEIQSSPLDMTVNVAEAIERLRTTIADCQAEIECPACWPTALGYGPWIEEVWTNYISNALKYGGDPPRIELGAAEPFEDYVEFWVKDNGRGIPAEKQGGLFTPFTRLGQSDVQGYGLGLSIVHQIMDKLGGSAGVRSRDGEGSTFYFRLPAA